MGGYTKLINGYWVSSGKKKDDTWVAIVYDENNKVSFPLGLAEQETRELLPSKESKLNELIVVTDSGKRFYANPEARTDITAVIIEATEQGSTNEAISPWKTPDGIIDVTLAELKEVNKLALEAKATIIGI